MVSPGRFIFKNPLVRPGVRPEYTLISTGILVEIRNWCTAVIIMQINIETVCAVEL